MKFIKKYKLQQVGLVLIIILVLFAIVLFVQILYPSSNQKLYGNRLLDIQKYPITKIKIDNMKKDINLAGISTNITYDLEGKIINVMIDVKADTTVVLAKALGDKVLAAFTDVDKGYYDIQQFIICSAKVGVPYPVIGYKHHTTANFVWSNNI